MCGSGIFTQRQPPVVNDNVTGDVIGRIENETSLGTLHDV
jgi:hypothetical protein